MRRYILCIITALIMLVMSFSAKASNSNIEWTKEEKQFMEEHPTIRMGIDPSFVPFEFIDKDGEYKGIAADYIDLIEEKTGFKMKVVEELTWAEAYEEAINGTIDVLPAISKTREREQYFIFSQPYYYFKRIIVTRDTDTKIKGINDLYGRTVAVQRNSSYQSYLMELPNINLSLYESVEEALTAVANGTEAYYLGNLTTSNYIIHNNGLTNLKFVAFEAEKKQGIQFAVRKDWPELVDILDKALDSINQQEKENINNKWINTEIETDYWPIIRIVLIITSTLILIWLVSIYWILKLKKEIKQRIEMQEDLERMRKEAENANDIKSKFLARMSHEIRTPLNAIMGMAYLQKKTSLSITQKLYNERIIKSSNSMLGLINDILDFAKMEADKIELERISFSLDQVIQDVVNIVSYKIDERELEFRLIKNPQLPTWFYGDSKRLEQILINLINNATKFTSKGEISFEIAMIAKEEEYCHIEFILKDTGIGMSQSQIADLFEPFSQGDSSINRRFGGTGLGLSIVKNLIEMMGGEIQVFSTPLNGSTFLFRIRLEIDQPREAHHKDERYSVYSVCFNNLRSLVLEKMGEDRNLIDNYLGAFGMQCEMTSSEITAINMLETIQGDMEHGYDLLIVDYKTPTENGFQFIETLRKNKKIIKFPKIIMLFPMMREDLFDLMEEYQIDIGIGKPIISSVLYNALIELFHNKSVAIEKTNNNMVETKKVMDMKQLKVILVVDDNTTNQLIVQSLLEEVGYRVYKAGNGKEGIAIFKEHQMEIDLILMDLHMPLLNGYEASLEIRKISADVPIIAMTADVIQGVIEKCNDYGIYQYISKPFRPEQLIACVHNAVYKEENAEKVGEIFLDQAHAFKMLGNNPEIYRKVITEFLNENQNTVDELSNLLQVKEYAQAAQMVHKIKSSLGTIGTEKIRNQSIDLQRMLEENEEQEIVAVSQSFLSGLSKLLEEIKKELLK
ncbi:MAG: response regulator [Velocimicrobium sp.]